MQWQGSGSADTPGADAVCRMLLCLGEDGQRIKHAAFEVFGPPVAVACADWACEWLSDRTIAAARSLSVKDFEQALALAPSQRYAALLVADALAEAFRCL
ncbi:FeS cluster assembly scaffold IscU [Salinisphaera sp. T31B1]